ncbi:MAG: tetratricopeptide repeat protein [Calditrichaceae bacterium]|nr:tetratricopeptide repeat protein [Calditrichaceae bacterium]HES60227.1 tetratricopeptide repeat protein [Caldithrix sp.]
MKKILFLSFILLFGLELALAQEDARNAEAGQAYNSGLELARKEKFKEAVAEFKKAVAADANFPQAHYMLAVCYKKLSDYKNAEAQFKEAINKDSKFEVAYVALANLQAEMDRITDAINTFSAALAFSPNSAKANYGLGKIYYDQKKFTNALPLLEKATQADANYSLAYSVKGLTLKALRRYEEAEKAFQSAIDTERKRTSKGTFYYYLGEVHMLEKKYNQAIDAFNNALKMSRSAIKKAGANFNLGKIYQSMGQNQKARQYFKDAAKNSSWKQAAEYEIDIIDNPSKYSN